MSYQNPPSYDSHQPPASQYPRCLPPSDPYHQALPSTYEHPPSPPPSHMSNSSWARPQDTYSPVPVSINSYQPVPHSTYESFPSHISQSLWSRPQDSYSPPSLSIYNHPKANPHSYDIPSAHALVSDSSWARPQDTYQPPSHTYQPTYEDSYYKHSKYDAQYEAWEKEKMSEKKKADAMVKADTAWRRDGLKNYEKHNPEAMKKMNDESARGSKDTGKKVSWKEKKAKEKEEQEKWSKAWAVEMGKQDEEWMGFMRSGSQAGDNAGYDAEKHAGSHSGDHSGKKADWKSMKEREDKEYQEAMAKEDEEWRAFLRSGAQAGNHHGKKPDWKSKKEWEETEWEKEKADALNKADEEWRECMMAAPADKMDRVKQFWKKNRKGGN